LTATGVTALLAAEATLVPTLFVAVTENVNSVPFANEDTTHDSEVFVVTATVHVPPDGFDRTV
jgi:hypothetical protein